MQAVIGFFQGIGSAIESVIDFVVSFFQDLVYLITLTGKFLAAIPGYFSWLPAPLLVILLPIFSIVVLYKVLGRE